MRKTVVVIAALFLLAGASGLPIQKVSLAGGLEESVETSKLRIAAAQHEIIAILLSEERYSEVLPEFRKILSLKLSGENERLVVQEAWLIVERLREAERHGLAHQIVAETLAHSAEDPENRFTLLMLKGKLYYDEGKLEEAISVYRRAQQLQGS